MAEPAHGAQAASGGMPQLDFTTFPSQIFWLIVALTVLYYVLTRMALPKIAGAIEERHDAIEDDLDRAAEFKRRAHQAEQAYLAALAAAKAEVDEVVARAEAEIAAKAAASEARIAAVRAEAAASVRRVARETAEALVVAMAPGFRADPAQLDAAVAARTR